MYFLLLDEVCDDTTMMASWRYINNTKSDWKKRAPIENYMECVVPQHSVGPSTVPFVCQNDLLSSWN